MFVVKPIKSQYFIIMKKKAKFFRFFPEIYAFLLRTNRALDVPTYAIGCPKATRWLCLSVLILFFLSPQKRPGLFKKFEFLNSPYFAPFLFIAI